VSEPSLTTIFRELPKEDRALVLGTIRTAISAHMAKRSGLNGTVSGEVWLLLHEILEEGDG